jgi:hypothetical protein
MSSMSELAQQGELDVLGVVSKKSSRASLAASKVQQRRNHNQGNPYTSDRYYDDEEAAVIKAMARYKQENHIRFETVMDYLKVFKGLGYVRQTS